MCKLPLLNFKTLFGHIFPHVFMSIFGNILALHMYLNYSNKGYGGFGDTKVNERITEIAGSSFTGGKPTDTQAQKKSVRDKVNGEISALHRSAYKAACYYLKDDHPELYEEIEEDIDAFHNNTKAVERETRIDLRSQKFNIK